MLLKNVLKTYGLNEKQARVYLACLQLGSAPAHRISQSAGLPRSTCYEILETLKPLGLISAFKKHQVLWFSATDPHALVQTAKEKAAMLEQHLPQFLAAYGEIKNRPSVRFYQGREGMKIILNEILEEAKELLGFSSYDDLEKILGDLWPKFVQQRAKKKIFAKIILRETTKAYERQRLGPQELREVRIISPSYEFHGVTYIWENKITMFSFGQDLSALVIDSKELAQVQKNMFYALWNSLPNKKPLQ